MPTEHDITRWVQATGANGDAQRELLERLAAARIEYSTHRETSRRGGGLHAQQQTYAEQERSAARIVEYRPSMMPGLVQTPAYGREAMRLSFTTTGEEETERVVAARMERQHVLYEPGHHIQMVIGEAGLRVAPGTLDTLLGQLDRLTTIAGLAQVELGIIPFPSMPIMPLAGFSLRDRVASVETVSGQQYMYDSEEVDTYERAFEVARSASVIGDDAVALIRRVAEQLRQDRNQ